MIEFILGMAAGIWLYRTYIIFLTGKFGHTACDYCIYAIKKREMKKDNI